MDEQNQRLIEICRKLPFDVVDLYFNYHQEHAYYFLGDENQFDGLKRNIQSKFNEWELHDHVSSDYYLTGDFGSFDNIKSLRVRKYLKGDETLVDIIFLLKSSHHEENVLVARVSPSSFNLDRLIEYLNSIFTLKLEFVISKNSYEHKLSFKDRLGDYISNKQMSISLDTITSIRTVEDNRELLHVLPATNIVEIEFGDISLGEMVINIENVLGINESGDKLFARKLEKKADLVLNAINQNKTPR